MVKDIPKYGARSLKGKRSNPVTNKILQHVAVPEEAIVGSFPLRPALITTVVVLTLDGVRQVSRWAVIK